MLRKLAMKYGSTDDPHTSTLFAAILVAFFCFLRKSNYTTHTSTSFNVDKDLTMSKLIKVGNRFAIKLTHTKTIQYQQREIVIWLPNFPDSDICPTRALTRMLKLRRTHWYHEITQTCPLFAQDRKGTPLAITTFRAFLEKSLTSVGVNTAQISPHSLRRGGTTFAFECGCDRACIKLQGDWLSDAYLIYMDVTDRIKQTTVQKMERALSRCV
jgi:hypothetical protein